jgi:nitrile hydratase accessory protein
VSASPGIDADLEGRVSPPRDNGEIVFAAPWEQRAFGLAIALCRSRAFEWESFRARLIARIAQDDSRPYWRSWSAALEDVLEESRVLTRGETDARQLAFLARPAGHDHDHEH